MNACVCCIATSSSEFKLPALMPPVRCCYCGKSARPTQRFQKASPTALQHAAEVRAVRGAPTHAAATHICPAHQTHPPPSASSVVLQQLKYTGVARACGADGGTQVRCSKHTAEEVQQSCTLLTSVRVCVCARSLSHQRAPLTDITNIQPLNFNLTPRRSLSDPTPHSAAASATLLSPPRPLHAPLATIERYAAVVLTADAVSYTHLTLPTT